MIHTEPVCPYAKMHMLYPSITLTTLCLKEGRKVERKEGRRFTHPNITAGFDQRPRPLHNRCTRRDTGICWGMTVTYSRYKFVAGSLPKRFRDGRKDETKEGREEGREEGRTGGGKDGRTE